MQTNTPSGSRHRQTEKDFHLIGNFTLQKVLQRPKQLPDSPRATHSLVKIEGRRKFCGNCSKKNRLTPAGSKIQTTYKCKNCDLSLRRMAAAVVSHLVILVQFQLAEEDTSAICNCATMKNATNG
ncbi:hypothetical protein J437_LFUL016202 [Ladona fulva]|uniref:Uncharacterized protein n=1 Tax=Ladona fulva TaxID=123851 RepID=A0A8K0PB92_LADFU|nr:hypothetical protein J437_LFUL016202 [Ladona fulva]